MAVALVPARGRRLTSGGGMRRVSGTGLRVSQVSFAPEKRRTCTRPLPGSGTPPAYPGERRCRGRIRRVFTHRRLGGIPPAPPARKSACLRPRHSCLPGMPRVPLPERASRSRPTVGAHVGRTLAGRAIPADNGDVTARDVLANRTTPALCAKPSTRRGTRRQGWTRETCAGASGRFPRKATRLGQHTAPCQASHRHSIRGKHAVSEQYRP